MNRIVLSAIIILLSISSASGAKSLWKVGEVWGQDSTTTAMIIDSLNNEFGRYGSAPQFHPCNQYIKMMFGYEDAIVMAVSDSADTDVQNCYITTRDIPQSPYRPTGFRHMEVPAEWREFMDMEESAYHFFSPQFRNYPAVKFAGKEAGPEIEALDAALEKLSGFDTDMAIDILMHADSIKLRSAAVYVLMQQLNKPKVLFHLLAAEMDKSNYAAPLVRVHYMNKLPDGQDMTKHINSYVNLLSTLLSHPNPYVAGNALNIINLAENRLKLAEGLLSEGALTIIECLQSNSVQFSSLATSPLAKIYSEENTSPEYWLDRIMKTRPNERKLRVRIDDSVTHDKDGDHFMIWIEPEDKGK